MISSNGNGNGVMSKRSIYLGAFVHCTSLQHLDICEAAAIGVDSDGKIAFIERDVGDISTYALPEGWENAKTIKIHDQGFFFPGFIGECKSHEAYSALYQRLTFHRYTHTRLTVPKLGHLWQINPPGLAQHVHFSSRILL
jgi:hypothetical protein